MSRKLTYFDIPGYGEAIRYILHYGGLKFEDVRLQRSEWPIKEIKDTLPYGQLPLYEENGRKLNQSIAIARYVSSQAGLVPEDPWEQAVLDAAVLNLYDMFKKLWSAAAEPEDKRPALIAEAIEFFYSRIERDLKANNGHYGGKLTWADFILAASFPGMKHQFKVSVEKDYPTITALVNKVANLPGVKEYIESRNYEY